MSADIVRDYWDDWGLVLLWTAFFLGPLAVSIDLGAGYAMVKPICAAGHPLTLRALSFVALAITGAGVVIGWSCFTRVRHAAIDDGGRVVDRSYFVAVVAIGLNVLCAILIVTAALGRFVLPCE